MGSLPAQPRAQKMMAEVARCPPSSLSWVTRDAVDFGVFQEQLKTAQARCPASQVG